MALTDLSLEYRIVIDDDIENFQRLYHHGYRHIVRQVRMGWVLRKEYFKNPSDFVKVRGNVREK